MIQKVFCAVLSLLFCVESIANEKVKDTTYYYTLKPVVRLDRTDLEITLHFQTNSDTAISIQFKDYYSTPQLYKYVTSFKGLNGTEVKETGEPGIKLIKPDEKGTVSLTYYISFDPEELRSASYAPDISATFFHLAACQWMLLSGASSTPHLYNIRIIDSPKGWNLYSSAGPDPLQVDLKGTFRQLFNKYWGGGTQSHKQFFLKGKKIDVYISDKILLPQQEVLNAVYRIVQYERDLFNDHDFPFYTITILPREDNVAGLRVKNMFMCYVQPNVTRYQLFQLIAHEMSHEWLGGKISMKDTDDDPGFKYHWLTEGFADYIAYRTLLILKLITAEEFVTLINRCIVNIADNTYRNYSMQALTDLANKGRYGTEATKLQYYRGALMALNAQRDLERAGNKQTLENFIRQLYDSTRSFTEGITESFLFEFAGRRHIDLQTPFEKNILHGDPIMVYDDALGKKYSLKETSMSSFELGFSLNESSKVKKIMGLLPGSAAEKAGLKEGMEFLGIENYNRFGNNWRFDLPALVHIKENGIEKTISYFPAGKLMVLLLYTKSG